VFNEAVHSGQLDRHCIPRFVEAIAKHDDSIELAYQLGSDKGCQVLKRLTLHLHQGEYRAFATNSLLPMLRRLSSEELLTPALEPMLKRAMLQLMSAPNLIDMLLTLSFTGGGTTPRRQSASTQRRDTYDHVYDNYFQAGAAGPYGHNADFDRDRNHSYEGEGNTDENAVTLGWFLSVVAVASREENETHIFTRHPNLKSLAESIAANIPRGSVLLGQLATATEYVP
jgi:hypothetical protein